MNDNGGQPAMNDPNKQQSSADVRAECKPPLSHNILDFMTTFPFYEVVL